MQNDIVTLVLDEPEPDLGHMPVDLGVSVEGLLTALLADDDTGLGCPGQPHWGLADTLHHSGYVNPTFTSWLMAE